MKHALRELLLPILISLHSVDYAGPSIGVIIAEADVRDPETLLGQADAAMYVVKRARKEAAVRC